MKTGWLEGFSNPLFEKLPTRQTSKTFRRLPGLSNQITKLSANTMENGNGSIMQNDDIMSTNGQLASDLDFSTTAAVRNMESSDDDADYPGRMSTGGYGGSENMDDDLEDDEILDDEDALDDEDDDLANDDDDDTL